MTKISNQYSLTNILTADLANSRLGINNVSPAYSLDLTGIARVTTSAYFATASGSVGIGTTSPVSTLNVSGTTGINWVGSGSVSYGLVTIGTGGTAGGSLWVNTASLNSNFHSGFGVTGTYGTPAQRSVINLTAYGAYSTGGYGSDLAFSTTNGVAIIECMRITNAGVVSIGTTTAQYGNLNVKSNGTASYQGFNLYAQGNANFTHIQHTGSLGIIGTSYDGTGGTGYTPLTFWTSDTERVRIHANGNVVIGSSTDNGNKLNVVGNISSNSTVSGGTGSFGTVNASAFKSFVGSTSIAAGATATIYTMDTMGLYTVQASYVGSSIIFCASAIFYAQIYSGNYVKCLDLYDGANIYLFNSGASIQVRNDGYGTYSFSWTILFQPAF